MSHKLHVLYQPTTRTLKPANYTVSSKYISDVATKALVSGNFTAKATLKQPLSLQLNPIFRRPGAQARHLSDTFLTGYLPSKSSNYFCKWFTFKMWLFSQFSGFSPLPFPGATTNTHFTKPTARREKEKTKCPTAPGWWCPLRRPKAFLGIRNCTGSDGAAGRTYHHIRER